MSLLKSSAIIASLTMLSRVFGFIRDAMIAYFLPVGVQSDAFFVAFKLPNFMRRLFAEGAFNAAFLPMFAGMVKTRGQDEALRFGSETFSYLLAVLVIFTALAILFMPHLMWALAPGFQDDPEKFNLTIILTRITFPYLIFISLTCLLSGILNSFEKFAAVAATPILLNLTMILVLLASAPFVGATYGLTYGVVVAGVTQLLWLVYFCRRSGIMPTLHRPRLTPDVKKLLAIIAPAALGAGVTQINSMVDMLLASTMDKAVSYLYFAERLYELPLAVIGIAVATALLPMLSKHIRAGETDSAVRGANHAIMLVMFFGMPCAGALVTIAEPIIQVVYERGEFTLTDRASVFPALIAFASGLPAYLLAKIFSSSFFAAQDTKTPVRIAVICVTTNIVLSLLLMGTFRHVGLAMATSVAGWTNALLLGGILYRRGMFLPDRRLMVFLAKVTASTGVMMGALVIGSDALAGWFAVTGAWKMFAGMVVLVGGGGGIYFVVAALLRTITVGELKAWLKVKSKASAPQG